MNMRDKLEAICASLTEKRGHMIAGMIKPYVIDCDEETMSSTLGFPAMEWEKNPNDAIHGGIMATMIDTAIGITVIAFTETMTPTISLQLNYLLPCPADGTVAVRSRITMRGGTIVHTTAEAYDTREPEKLIATAQGTYRVFKTAKHYTELL